MRADCFIVLIVRIILVKLLFPSWLFPPLLFFIFSDHRLRHHLIYWDLWLHQRHRLNHVSNLLVKSDESLFVIKFFATFILLQINGLHLKNFLVSINHSASDSHHLKQLPIFFVCLSSSLKTLNVSLCHQTVLTAGAGKRLNLKIRVLSTRWHYYLRLSPNIDLYHINAPLEG